MRGQSSAGQPAFTTRTGFERKLAIYVLASGAMLGVPVAAESATIYSGLMNITVNSSDATPYYVLDVDGNGVDDFQLDAIEQFNVSEVNATGLNDNRVFTTGLGFEALNLGGSTTLPGNLKTYQAGKLSRTYYGNSYNPVGTKGQWSPDGDPGYLVLMFDIDGNTHYGWAQVRAYTNSGNLGEVWPSSFTLVDWAWESTPGGSIHIPGAEIPEPSTLSLFALGAAGILAWRRRQKAVKQ